MKIIYRERGEKLFFQLKKKILERDKIISLNDEANVLYIYLPTSEVVKLV